MFCFLGREGWQRSPWSVWAERRIHDCRETRDPTLSNLQTDVGVDSGMVWPWRGDGADGTVSE